MIPIPEEEERIRNYLLGNLPPQEEQQIEERLLTEHELIDQLMLIEDELIDDYLFDMLSGDERERFEKHFLRAPGRERKLGLARQLVDYASSTKMSVAEALRDEVGPTGGVSTDPFAHPAAHPSAWMHWLFTPWWKFAAYAAIIVTFGLWLGQGYLFRSPVDSALVALNDAYRDERPVGARITGFSYSEFKSPYQRGGNVGKEDKTTEVKHDELALQRAKKVLFGANLNSSEPAVLHALGKYYLTQQEFDQAINQLRKALTFDPNNPKVHSDLGAALLGRIERDRYMNGRRGSEDAAACLEHLNRALELAPSLPEALFNRALFYQGERMRHEARQDWEKYRQLDPHSPWSREALDNLQTIEMELR